MSTDDNRTPVVHKIVADDLVLVVSDHASARKLNDQRGEVGYAASERAGLKSSTDRQEDGSYATHLAGRPVRGEGDTLYAARILVDTMNLRANEWQAPKEAPANLMHVDCVVEHHSVGREPLHIQVVRAITDEELYQTLARDRVHASSATPPGLTLQLAASIRLKEMRIEDPTQRALIVLLLDANRLPQFSMTEVKTAVLTSLVQLCAASGFKEVWLVGPTTEHTYRIWPE
jgi:hypothetical protein